MYLYLLFDKYEALDAFKVYKKEVEKLIDKTIKIVRSTTGEEYYVMMPDFGRVRGLFLRECARVVVVLRLGICMWFGPVNKETYVHGCDRARSLCIGNSSGDRDDPTGLELSPVGRSGLYRPGVLVPYNSERERSRERGSPFREWVGPFYRIQRPTRTW